MGPGSRKIATLLWPNSQNPPRHQSTTCLAAITTALRHVSPSKAGKNVSNGKYHDKVKETKLYQWLMLHVATKVDGEKMLSLHHPFDNKINEAINNAVSWRCPKNKVFAGSGGLQYRVALVAGQHTQGATQYTKDVYTKQFGMEMLQLQESFWRQRKSDRTTMQPTKPGNPNGKGNETKKCIPHNLKQSNKKGKTTNQVRLTALVLR